MNGSSTSFGTVSAINRIWSLQFYTPPQLTLVPLSLWLRMPRTGPYIQIRSSRGVPSASYFLPHLELKLGPASGVYKRLVERISIC